MIVGAGGIVQLQPRQFDTIIVGAGAVGIPLAVRLARAGRRVALLEAGGAAVAQASQALFAEATQSGRPLAGLGRGRFRALGGSTSFWGGQLVRFDPIVFEPRPWAGDAAWPLTHAELAPFYAEAAAILGQADLPPDDAPVWRQMRVAPPPASATVEPYLSRWLPETDFATLFRHELAQLPSLTVLLDAPVVALEADGPMIRGVTVATAAGRVSLAADRVILANGTVEIARLLQLPLADGAAAPWAINKWLGRGFMDHLDCTAGTLQVRNRHRFGELFDSFYVPGGKYLAKLKLTQGAQRHHHLLGIAAHFDFRASLGALKHDARILLNALNRGQLDWPALRRLPSRLAEARFIGPMLLRYLRQRRMYNVLDGGVTLRLTAEQRPLFDSRISLRPERDRLGVPTVDLDWRVDDATFGTMAFFAREVALYLAEAGLADVRLDPRLLARDPAFFAAATDGFHHMGGARMSATPASGVVDPQLRVHGSRNLFVAGAAVYPSAGFANPTFTAIALAMRLAHDIEHGRV